MTYVYDDVTYVYDDVTYVLIIWSPCLQEDDYMSHMCPNMSHMCPNASCPVDNSYTNNLVAVLAGG